MILLIFSDTYYMKHPLSISAESCIYIRDMYNARDNDYVSVIDILCTEYVFTL